MKPSSSINQQSSQPPNSKEKQADNQEHHQRSTNNPYIPPQFLPGATNQEQESTQNQPKIYVLPYPPPPFHFYQQQPVPDAQSYPHHEQLNQQSKQSTQPYQQKSAESENSMRSHQQQSKSSEQSHQSNQPQSPQPEQSTQTNQQQSAYPGHPYQQPFYGPGPWFPPQPFSNNQYGAQYPAQPPAAHDSPMVRKGPWREQRQTPEPGLQGWTGFEEKEVRAIFIRKVYAILMCQLLFSLGIIALFVFEPHVKRFVQQNIYLYYISLAVFVGVYLGMACIQSARRKFPLNIIVLCVFTVAMSYMLGTISSMHKTEVVFMAVGICAAVCLAVSVFSFYTKFDFTSCGGVLCILLLILIMFGLIAIFIPSRVMTIIYASLGAIVFTLYLAYDTQMMMGGKSYEMSPEEHVFAAVQLYVDIVQIFLFLLLLLGGNEN